MKPLPSLLRVTHGLPEFPLHGTRARVTNELRGQRTHPNIPQSRRYPGSSPQGTSTPQSPLPVSTPRPPSCPWRGVGKGRLGLRGQSPAPAHPARPGPSHRRSTRSSASSCHSSWRHRRSRSAWASEPSGRKSLGPCDLWGSFWDRERAARSSEALGERVTRSQHRGHPARLRTPRTPRHPQAGQHLSTRPAGTSTDAGSESGSIWLPSAAARVSAFSRTARAPPTPRTRRGPSARVSRWSVDPPSLWVRAFLPSLCPSTCLHTRASVRGTKFHLQVSRCAALSCSVSCASGGSSSKTPPGLWECNDHVLPSSLQS